MKSFAYKRLYTSILIASAALGGNIQATQAGTIYTDNSEPPVNSYLADSPWPMSHRNPYQQASSPLPGPTGQEELAVHYKPQQLTAVTLNYGNRYKDGTRSVYGSTPLTMYKTDMNGSGIKKIDVVSKSGGSLFGNVESGAYSIVDIDGSIFVPQETKLIRYSDEAPKVESSLVEDAIFEIPSNLLSDESEYIIGINLSYNGRIVFVTSHGLIGSISRDFNEVNYHSLNGEEVSNSIAIDEEGGIYVVTNRNMHRLNMNELGMLSHVWSATYEYGPDDAWPGRLGTGSGSTPTLMGTGADEDKFVVFTDGQELTHLVLMWRDEIPDGWQPIAPGKDIRIAAEIPVKFGLDDSTRSISEQSVLVSGYGAMVVNNDYTWDTGDWPIFGDKWTVALSGLELNQPFGMEKFQWNTETNSIESSWANQVSCPNGIPTMSRVTNLAYCIGARDNTWTLEGVDWDTGESVFHKKTGFGPAYNSLYAATQIGDSGDIVTGTLAGMVRVQPGENRDPMIPVVDADKGVPYEIDENGNLLPSGMGEYLAYAAAVDYGSGEYFKRTTTVERKAELDKKLKGGECSSQWGHSFNGYKPYIVLAFPSADTTYFSYTLQDNKNTPIIRFSGELPHTRYYSYNLYDSTQGKASQDGGILDSDIRPDKGSINPYVQGADRNAENRSYSVWYVPEGKTNAYDALIEEYGEENVKYIDSSLEQPIWLLRTYLKDNGYDVTGLDDAALNKLPAIHTFNPNAKSVDKILSSPTACAEAQNFDTRALLSVIDTLPDVERVFPENDAFEDVNFLRAPGGAMFPTIHNDYGAAVTNPYKFGEVVDLTFRAPITPKTVNGEAVYDEEGTDLRFWSLCTGSLKFTSTGRCLSDSQVVTDGEMIRVIVGPNSLKDFVSENFENVNFLPWDGVHKVAQVIPNAELPEGWAHPDYPVLLHRNLIGKDGFGYKSVPNRPEGVHGPAVSDYYADKYMGDYAPTGKNCTVEAFTSEKGCK